MKSIYSAVRTYSSYKADYVSFLEVYLRIFSQFLSLKTYLCVRYYSLFGLLKHTVSDSRPASLFRYGQQTRISSCWNWEKFLASTFGFIPLSFSSFLFFRPFVYLYFLSSYIMYCHSRIRSIWLQLLFALFESSSKWLFTRCIKQNTWIHKFITGGSDFPHTYSYIFLCFNKAFSIVNEKNNHIDLTLTHARCSTANPTSSNHIQLQHK